MVQSPSVGESVYAYNSKLGEYFKGVVEGYYTDDYRVLKVLQKVSDGYIRHVIAIENVRYSEEDIKVLAVSRRREIANEQASREVYAGSVVHLLDKNGETLKSVTGNPLKYQVVAVYSKQARVKLVTDYGEEIGMYDISEILVTEEKPLFTMDAYSVGETVVWAEYEDVYEGKIINLHTTSAEIGSIRKLFPTDHRRRIPYYKIPKSSISRESSVEVLTTIKDDTTPEKE